MQIASCILTQERDAQRKRRELTEQGIQSWVEYDPYDGVFWLFWNGDVRNQRLKSLACDGFFGGEI